jgi:hypothetical protein
MEHDETEATAGVAVVAPLCRLAAPSIGRRSDEYQIQPSLCGGIFDGPGEREEKYV